MDNLLIDGDMIPDFAGDVQKIRGYKEIIQRAMIRLTMKKGSFAYQPELGSRLHHLDIHKIDQFTLLSIVSEALADMEEITVLDVERTVNQSEKILYLTVYLQINGQNAMLEVKNKLWGDA